MTSSVDGLVSGLSTSSLISQLMTVEAAPQTSLKTKVTTAQTAVKSYQSVNTKLSSIKSAADSIGQLSTWRGIKAVSSSATVTATALTGTNGAAGTTTFDVKALAKSQLTTARVSGTDPIVDADSITITVGPLDGSDSDKTVTIDVSKDKTAAGVASAINAAGIGVKAALVATSGTDKVLQLSGTKTGSSNSFDVQGLGTAGTAVSLINVAAASDARLEVGGGDANSVNGGYDVTSSTNTFTGLMPGVSITVAKEEDGVTINATSDVSGIADKFQALVDAANATLDEISKQTAYDASTKKGSPLTGDFAVRNMSQTILSAVSQGLSYDDPAWVRPDPDTVPPSTPDKINFGSLAQFGVQLDDTGHLTFNSAKFTESYADDPSKIQQAGIALGDQFEAMAGNMSINVQSVITGRNNEIDRMNTQIDDWDVRLDAKRAALQKQYSDLEVALGKLKDQSNWLSGQLAGLH